MKYTISEIKAILLKENEDRVLTLWAKMNRWERDYFERGIRSTQDEIKSCQSYEDLDRFIGYHIRMTLQEWIDSL
jgi:hypothetical protein